MKKLYNTLTDVLTQFGFNMATWGEDTQEPDERTARIEVVEQAQLEPQFAMYSATFNVVFLHGDWASNASNLSDALMTFIPLEDRPSEECKELADNSDKLTLLEVPQFSEILVEYNEDTAEEEHSVSVTIYYQD